MGRQMTAHVRAYTYRINIGEQEPSLLDSVLLNEGYVKIVREDVIYLPDGWSLELTQVGYQEYKIPQGYKVFAWAEHSEVKRATGVLVVSGYWLDGIDPKADYIPDYTAQPLLTPTYFTTTSADTTSIRLEVDPTYNFEYRPIFRRSNSSEG